MSDLDANTVDFLDALVPSYQEIEPDWGTVLRRAQTRSPRRSPGRAVLVAAAVLVALGVGAQHGIASRVISYLTAGTPPVARHDLAAATRRFDVFLRTASPGLRRLRVSRPHEVARFRSADRLVRWYAAVDRHRHGYCQLALEGRHRVLGGSCVTADHGWAWQVSASGRMAPMRVITGILPAGATGADLVAPGGIVHRAHVRPDGLFVLVLGDDGAGLRRVLEFRGPGGQTVLAVHPATVCFETNYRDVNTCGGGGTLASIPAPAPPTEGGPLATGTLRSLAVAVLARMHATGILKVQFAQPPELWTGAHGGWMYVTVATRRGAAGEYESWEADLLAGAVRAEALARRAGSLAGSSTLTPRSPRCSVSPRAFSCETVGGLIRGGLPYDPSTWPRSESALRARLTGRVRALHLDLVSLRFITPERTPVPLLVVRTPTARTDWTHANLVFSIFGDTTRYEGVFLEVLDRAGQPVYAAGNETRLSGGSGWTAHGHFGN